MFLSGIHYTSKEEKENPLGYSELHKLMTRVLNYILQKKEEMIRIGRTEGLAEAQKKLEAKVQSKINKGKSAVQTAEELEEDISVIQPIYDEILRKNKAEHE